MARRMDAATSGHFWSLRAAIPFLNASSCAYAVDETAATMQAATNAVRRMRRPRLVVTAIPPTGAAAVLGSPGGAGGERYGRRYSSTLMVANFCTGTVVGTPALHANADRPLFQLGRRALQHDAIVARAEPQCQRRGRVLGQNHRRSFFPPNGDDRRPWCRIENDERRRGGVLRHMNVPATAATRIAPAAAGMAQRRLE